MPSFALRDDSHCVDCEVRTGVSERGCKVYLECYACEYKIKVVNGMLEKEISYGTGKPKAKNIRRCNAANRT
jgi:hypothetical protein